MFLFKFVKNLNILKHHTHILYLYAANKSFADVVVRSGQTSNVKSLKFQSWEVMTNLYCPLLKNTELKTFLLRNSAQVYILA